MVIGKHKPGGEIVTPDAVEIEATNSMFDDPVVHVLLARVSMVEGPAMWR